MFITLPIHFHIRCEAVKHSRYSSICNLSFCHKPHTTSTDNNFWMTGVQYIFSVQNTTFRIKYLHKGNWGMKSLGCPKGYKPLFFINIWIRWVLDVILIQQNYSKIMGADFTNTHRDILVLKPIHTIIFAQLSWEVRLHKCAVWLQSLFRECALNDVLTCIWG